MCNLISCNRINIFLLYEFFFLYIYSCPLWSDDRRMNAESVIKVCQETVKQIKEKDPEIEINVDALLPKLPPKSNGPHDDIVYNAMVHI